MEKPSVRSDGSQRSDRSVGSDRSVRSTVAACSRQALRPSGGYRTLRSFQTTTLVYDATFDFCERFVDKRSRLVDQMVQAARSGRQNIAEGSRAAAISSQTELRLVGVARASLDELLLDFEDYLRQHQLPRWAKDDPQALAVRAIGRARNLDRRDPSDRTDPTDRSNHADQTDRQRYAQWLESRDPAIMANAIICLIHQANFLLDRQREGLERDFIENGGYTERLAAARRETRDGPSGPPCPVCKAPTVLRTARKGARSGRQFYGCSSFPRCSGLVELEPAARLK